ncbi:MAG: hypothetical protein D6732_27970 [Methanobacteriota archaeon]|nr:MAG: hypothetical protein D6732_27970 [Euryarchaeota archaeon]
MGSIIFVVSTHNDAKKSRFFFSPPFAHLLSFIKLICAFASAILFNLENLSNFLTFVALYLIFNQLTTYIVNENPESRIEYIDLASSFFSEVVILTGILMGYLMDDSSTARLVVLSLLVVTLAISYVNAKFGSMDISTKFVYYENSTRIGLLLLGGIISQFFAFPLMFILLGLLMLSLIILLLQLFYANSKLTTN